MQRQLSSGKKSMEDYHNHKLNSEENMKYKVTNLTGAFVKFGNIKFEPNETKILENYPKSDRFHVEEIEELKKRTLKGGK